LAIANAGTPPDTAWPLLGTGQWFAGAGLALDRQRSTIDSEFREESG
jgi:hypothetical protein